MLKRLMLPLFCAAALSGLVCTPALAQDGSNVLLVLNTGSSSGEEIAIRYARARSVPSDNIVRIATAVTEDIDRTLFEREIQAPIGLWIARHAAQDRILYIVLTKGVPLRIQGTGGLGGTLASVDSELTLLYRRLVGNPTTIPGRIANPYFHRQQAAAAAEAFSHANHDIYLVSRLDGYTPDDVFQLIDRGSRPSHDGEIILDQRAHLLGERSGDMWLAEAAKELESKGFGDRLVLNTSREVVTGRKGVLGYYSWGSNDSSIKTRRFDLGFVPGALAAMFVSSDGRTFKEPPPTWALGSWTDPRTFYEGSPQSLTGDLIREGVTGIAGHVAEPFLDAAIRPQILFPAYLAGANLIESFYLAMPYLSWQTVVVGDPLCAPFRTKTLSTDLAKPELDPKTELPQFFSARREAVLVAAGVHADAAKFVLKGETRFARGDRLGGRQAMEAAVAIDARIARIHFLLASMDEEAGDYEAAILRYQAVLASAPDNFLALNNLAYALAVRKGKADEALPLALKAYELSKAQPQIADTLGWIQHLLRNDVEAEKLLTAARDAAPNAGEIRLHLARVYADSGRKDLAVSEVRRGLELQPELEKQETTQDLKRALGIN